MTQIHVYMYTIIRFSTGPRCVPKALCPDPPLPSLDPNIGLNFLNGQREDLIQNDDR